MFDQVDNPPNRHDARPIALEAARLHAHYWESDVTMLPWLGRPDGRYVFPLDALCRAAPASFPVFSRSVAAMYGDGPLRQRPIDEATDFAELLCGPSSDRILDRIYDVLSSRPKTLLHGDMRADNIFRSDHRRLRRAPLTFIDWQLIHVGPPGPELTGAWMARSSRRSAANDLTMLREYRDPLVRLDPPPRPTPSTCSPRTTRSDTASG